jgi:hypothetical protein
MSSMSSALSCAAHVRCASGSSGEWTSRTTRSCVRSRVDPPAPYVMATNAGANPVSSASAASSAAADSGERGGHSSKETKRPASMRSATVGIRAGYRAGLDASRPQTPPRVPARPETMEATRQLRTDHRISASLCTLRAAGVRDCRFRPEGGSSASVAKGSGVAGGELATRRFPARSRNSTTSSCVMLRPSRTYVSTTIGVDRCRSVVHEASEAASAARGPHRRAPARASTTARPRARSGELPLVV